MVSVIQTVSVLHVQRLLCFKRRHNCKRTDCLLYEHHVGVNAAVAQFRKPGGGY